MKTLYRVVFAPCSGLRLKMVTSDREHFDNYIKMLLDNKMWFDVDFPLDVAEGETLERV